VNGNVPRPARRGLRLTAVIAAGVCVLAIAAGAIAFSYSGVRDMALTAGLSPRLARFYPLLFDAVLIVACAAAVTLRGVLRGFAWLAVLVTIGAIATADTVHAMSITVPMRPLEVTIAIAPWVALLTGLTLLDAMIRRAPGRKTKAVEHVPANDWAPAAGSAESTAGQPAGAVVSLSALLHDSRKASAGQDRPAPSQPAAHASLVRTIASDPAANASDPAANASDPAANASLVRTIASEPAANASRARATASDPAADTSDPAAGTSDPAAGTSDPAAGTSDPAADTGEPAADAGEHAAGAGQLEAIASPPEASSGPAATGPYEGQSRAG
jgi:hypothetical protein